MLYCCDLCYNLYVPLRRSSFISVFHFNYSLFQVFRFHFLKYLIFYFSFLIFLEKNRFLFIDLEFIQYNIFIWKLFLKRKLPGIIFCNDNIIFYMNIQFLNDRDADTRVMANDSSQTILLILKKSNLFFLHILNVHIFENIIQKFHIDPGK